MKKMFLVASLLFVLLGASASAQQVKFGHINTNELLRVMPGRDSAQVVLERYARELETKFTEMQTELQTKLQDYVANQATLSELIRQSRQRELNSLQERIREFQELAQQDLVDRESALLTPILEAARKAIEEVAAANGYTYVFDTAAGALLVFPPGDNLLEKVKARVGVR